jgi:hypothetical protein
MTFWRRCWPFWSRGFGPVLPIQPWPRRVQPVLDPPPRDFIEYLQRQVDDPDVLLPVRLAAAKTLARHAERVENEERLRRIVREEIARSQASQGGA